MITTSIDHPQWAIEYEENRLAAESKRIREEIETMMTIRNSTLELVLRADMHHEVIGRKSK